MTVVQLIAHESFPRAEVCSLEPCALPVRPLVEPLATRQRQIRKEAAAVALDGTDSVARFDGGPEVLGIDVHFFVEAHVSAVRRENRLAEAVSQTINRLTQSAARFLGLYVSPQEVEELVPRRAAAGRVYEVDE
jgi:hypothetical protein